MVLIFSSERYTLFIRLTVFVSDIFDIILVLSFGFFFFYSNNCAGANAQKSSDCNLNLPIVYDVRGDFWGWGVSAQCRQQNPRLTLILFSCVYRIIG